MRAWEVSILRTEVTSRLFEVVQVVMRGSWFDSAKAGLGRPGRVYPSPKPLLQRATSS